MAEQVFPTKGNLIKTKRSLLQAQLGYDLMDKKHGVLVREMVSLIDTARELRGEIDITYSEAYHALEYANLTLGVVSTISQTFPVDNSLKLSTRSVMSVELPKVTANLISADRPQYSMTLTSSEFDKAYIKFNKVKKLNMHIAMRN